MGIRDFLPPPPWERPSLPTGLGSKKNIPEWMVVRIQERRKYLTALKLEASKKMSGVSAEEMKELLKYPNATRFASARGELEGLSVAQKILDQFESDMEGIYRA